MLIRALIPRFRKVKDPDSVKYTLFTVDVWKDGHKHVLEKRYSEFEEMHKQLKKMITTPDFPPKKVLKWNPRVLENRRAGLQDYLEDLLKRESISKILLRFLEIDTGSTESIDQIGIDQSSQALLIDLPEDSWLEEDPFSALPEIEVEGVLQAMYDPLPEYLEGHIPDCNSYI